MTVAYACVLIVCIYVGISGRIPFKGGGGECETQEKRFFFLNKRIGNYYRDGIDKNLDLSLDLG